MNLFARLWHSSLGKKYLMAVSGCLLLLFVLGHLVGNLQIFLGREALNAYGEFLHSKPAMIWAARLGLLAIVGLHIVSALRLTAENRAARPVPYAGRGTTAVAATYASRTMMMSGLIVAAFVLYHLLHFTAQMPGVNLTGTDFRDLADGGRHDVYGMVVAGFRQPVVTGFYVLAMFLLCLHLSHGISAMAQSLGCKPCCPAVLDWGARAMAGLIFLGYVSIPISILLGMVK